MTSGEQTSPQPAQLPMAPSRIRSAALAELGRLGGQVQEITLQDWTKPSAVAGWTIGDVVAHLNLSMALHGRLLSAVVAGKGSGNVWKTVGQLSERVLPFASPAINALNSAIPRVIDRALSPEVIKAQFVSSSRTLQDKLMKVGSSDYTRPVYYRGGPWPLSFFLANVVDELALHGWDIASPLDPDAYLSEDARSVLPWYFWSGTPYMLQLPKQLKGTIQVSVDSPQAEMWWSVGEAETKQGLGQTPDPDVTITGASGAFVLTLAGRIPAQDALRATSLQATGNHDLGRAFLGAWKIV